MILNYTGDTAETRIDRYVSDNTGLTRNAVQRLIESGNIAVNGKAVKKNRRLEPGDIVSVETPELKPAALLPNNIPLDIVFEDRDIIVVNKPKGMVVHPSAGHEDMTLCNALLYHCGGSLSGINGELRPGIVHRIDKDTSGLIVAAKNDEAHLSLAEQIKEHSCGRVYEAIARGGFGEDSGRIDAPIGRHRTDRKRMAVTAYNSRQAATSWEVISRYQGYTHLRLTLETGRTHQIRVHLAYIGHPVAGDSVYGGSKADFSLDSQCLHAKKLELVHPRSGEKMVFESELPDYFKNILTRLESGV
ncbi:MAG: RluA family pseudouridine synthase [Oscillospiraceae bacterium]|jgi:23S rRNA pseudouridine1911/1915/1917 synthase|nr:RluA family pseudouridine synthase [Oscillospiraceae bacterium]